MELTIEIKKTSALIQTKSEQINKGQRAIKIKPFISSIQGLVLLLFNAQGETQKVSINVTDFELNPIDISNYGWYRFEYTFSDKDYNMQITIF